MADQTTKTAKNTQLEDALKNMHIVIKQDWLESKRGWGTRSDGCSLHKSQADLKTFVDAYWAGMPDAVPDEYSRPEDSPCEVYVDAGLYRQIEQSEHGVRMFKSTMMGYYHNLRMVRFERD